MPSIPPQKISYSHDALIDQIIAQPRATQGELAALFGYSQAWVSTVMSSDLFKARLAQRRAEIVDPVLTANVEERFEAIVRRSQDTILEKLDAGASPDFALKALEVASRASGYGARPQAAGNPTNIQFVVQVPSPSASGAEWQAQHVPGREASPGHLQSSPRHEVASGHLLGSQDTEGGPGRPSRQLVQSE